MNINQRFVVLDIETTGINYEFFDEPTEIALIEIVNGKYTGNKQHFYLKPNKKVTLNFLLKIFGKNIIKEFKSKDFNTAKQKFLKLKNEKTLTDKEIKKYEDEIIKTEELANNMYKNIYNGKNKKDILPKIREFIKDSIVIGHNVQFDVNFLNYWFNNYKLPLIENYICTMKTFKNGTNEKIANLTYCCEYYNIELNGAHNALEDTQACGDLFLKEIEEYPDKINYNKYSQLDAYINFKKRVINTNYYSFAKTLLSDSCDIPINTEDINITEINACKNLFFKFKKPIEVATITGIELNSVEAIFIDWCNCLNINKHLDLIKDKYLKETILEIIKYTENKENLIRYCCKELTSKSPNFFLIKLIDKLNNQKETMEYSLNDLEYYFENLRDLNDLAKQINKDIEYIYNYLLIWIGTNNTRLLKYRQILREIYSKEKDKKLYNTILKSSNKDYILSRIK